MNQAHQNPGFSTDLHPIGIPRDFVSACADLDANAVLLLVHFFSNASKLEENIVTLPENELLESFTKWHGGSDEVAQRAVQELINKNLILRWKEVEQTYLIPGTPVGRFFLQALQLGERQWTSSDQLAKISLEDDRPNIFKLYETHIGPITPMMAEQLKQDETDFPADWIEDALREAVERNVRNWKYVKAILLAWRERGRDQEHEGHQSDIEAFRRLAREQQERHRP